MRVEKHGEGGADTTYDIEVEDMDNSVSEVRNLPDVDFSLINHQFHCSWFI